MTPILHAKLDWILPVRSQSQNLRLAGYLSRIVRMPLHLFLPALGLLATVSSPGQTKEMGEVTIPSKSYVAFQNHFIDRKLMERNVSIDIQEICTFSSYLNGRGRTVLYRGSAAAFDATFSTLGTEATFRLFVIQLCSKSAPLLFYD